MLASGYPLTNSLSILHTFQVRALQPLVLHLISSFCIEPSNDALYCHRIMRTFNFTLLAVFSCIAMIGATPLYAEVIGRQDEPMYVI
jgi:hypothetical protein